MSEGRFSRLEKSNPPASTPPVSAPASKSPKAESPTAAHAASTMDAYASFLSQGDEAFFSGNPREALRFYSRALQNENTQVYPWIGQVSALIAMQQYREAELWSNKALEQFPEDSSLLSQRARVLAATGNLKRAVGVSDYAISKGATMWSWLARGEVLLFAGDNNALFCFEKAIEMAGREDWRIPLLAGLAFFRKRQWANAEDFLRRSVEANSKNFYSWFELAKVQYELSYTDKVRDSLARVMQLKPDFKPAKELEQRMYRQPFHARILGFFRRGKN